MLFSLPSTESSGRAGALSETHWMAGEGRIRLISMREIGRWGVETRRGRAPSFARRPWRRSRLRTIVSWDGQERVDFCDRCDGAAASGDTGRCCINNIILWRRFSSWTAPAPRGASKQKSGLILWATSTVPLGPTRPSPPHGAGLAGLGALVDRKAAAQSGLAAPVAWLDRTRNHTMQSCHFLRGLLLLLPFPPVLRSPPSPPPPALCKLYPVASGHSVYPRR
jgi:hypothetical protein